MERRVSSIVFMVLLSLLLVSGCLRAVSPGDVHAPGGSDTGDGRVVASLPIAAEGNSTPYLMLPPSFNLTTDTLSTLDGEIYISEPGKVVSYLWDLGDGRTLNGSRIELGYPYPGRYNLTLTVVGDGFTLTSSSAVTVSAGERYLRLKAALDAIPAYEQWNEIGSPDRVEREVSDIVTYHSSSSEAEISAYLEWWLESHGIRAWFIEDGGLLLGAEVDGESVVIDPSGHFLHGVVPGGQSFEDLGELLRYHYEAGDGVLVDDYDWWNSFSPDTPEISAPSPEPAPVPVIDIVILNIEYDPPGNDRENLNGEWVEIFNSGEKDVYMGGWTLMDGKNHTYTFPEGFLLSPGHRVRVHTGEGADTSADLYMRAKTPIWNNEGDTALLLDDEGVIIDQYSYTPELTPVPTPHPTPVPAQTTPTTGVVITEISFDPEGNDRENLNGERVEILNNGTSGVDMSGWVLMDANNHTYVFPDGFRLQAGHRVRVHVGGGADTSTDLYMNERVPIWNNDGDIATLLDGEGEVVDRYSYGDV